MVPTDYLLLSQYQPIADRWWEDYLEKQPESVGNSAMVPSLREIAAEKG
jgi:hypothetical protein